MSDATGELAADADADGDRPRPRYRLALVVGLTIMLTVGSLGGWLGWQVRGIHNGAVHDAAFLQAARQGALNLTTIDWRRAESDVDRIVTSATGTFFDDFSKRSASFIEVVKQAQSISKGTVVSSGIQSEAGDEAKVLVAVNVDVSNASSTDQQSRSWRMRMTVRRVGDDVKVANVEFVP
ncbi:mammalian cell entry protein [Mycobacterium sp. 21AC1]|uniref:mammalian cell entry protein n=1 Tax=[Mycobacterium] appelbergii TaxID=2939269 RepID=UPI0029390E90|nr:mammalian cell entry protein [Mycobacterium sp. 21AC1]MDV3129936.1 mammalian cell entry protein [Mycobacterium sp. 21AC1]